MQSQQAHWDKIHRKGSINKYSSKASNFAIEVAKYLKKPAKVLELGCGSGVDAKFFAEKGHKVLATDFSSLAIQENTLKYHDIKNIDFEVLDTRQLEVLDAKNFDLIYARLSLHYFTNAETKAIFQAVQKKLKNGGVFAFICKAIDDSLFGKGDLIEENMYVLDGHVRHFFSEEYAIECLNNAFDIIKIESGSDVFYDFESSFIKVICKKK